MQSPDQAVPCTFVGCSEVFDTHEELRAHKIAEPEHYYCEKCDLDCSDWVDLTQHKVNLMASFLQGRTKGSGERPVHIVCEFCGEEFRSIGGQELHRKQVHRAEQSIVCPGCRCVFLRASSMLAHLEDGKCSIISSYDFRRAVQMKHIREKMMEDTEMADNVRRLGAPSTTDASTAADDQDSEDSDGGGASLDGTDGSNGSQDLIAFEDAHPTRPSSVKPGVTAASLSVKVAKLSMDCRSQNSGGMLTDGHEERTGSVQLHTPVWQHPETRKTCHPNAAQTSAAASTRATVHEDRQAVGGERNLFAHNICDVQSREWDAEQFFDPVIERYLCPFPGCKDQTFPDVTGIEGHFTYGHTKYHFPCPYCLKVFPKPSWLVNHIETSNQCHIQNTSVFYKLVDDISGGFMQVESVAQKPVYRASAALVKAGKTVDGVARFKFTGVMPLPQKPRW